MKSLLPLFCALILFTTARSMAAEDAIRVKVSPAVAFAPANLVVRTTVAADAGNRYLAIEAESDGFYRSSEVELEGESAPRTQRFEFRSLPPGSYQVRATLLDASGDRRASAHAQVTIVSADPNDR